MPSVTDAREDPYVKYPQYPRWVITFGLGVNWVIRWGWLPLTTGLLIAWLLDWTDWRTALAGWIAGMLLIGSLAGVVGGVLAVTSRNLALKKERESGKVVDYSGDPSWAKMFPQYAQYSRAEVRFILIVKALTHFGWIVLAGILLIAWLLEWARGRVLLTIGAAGLLVIGILAGVLHGAVLGRPGPIEAPPPQPDDKDSSEP
jgi:hypothetical protein